MEDAMGWTGKETVSATRTSKGKNEEELHSLVLCYV